MPLNIRDSEDSGQTGNTKVGPPVHKPKLDMSGGSKVGIAIAVVAVVAIGLFMMYKAGMFGTRMAPQPQEVFTQPVDTAAMIAAAESIATSMQSIESPPTESITSPKQEEKVTSKMEEPKPKSKPKPEKKREAKTAVKSEPKPVVKQPAGSGNYTIFIGSYSSKASANEEIGRWNEAGYHSFVSESSGKNGILYRVCLGRYSSKDEARQKAEKLKDAFESGYWVDMVK